jgi:hypothetical protein
MSTDPTSEVEMSWYYCLVHNRVEPEKGCANSERLGPYTSEDQAAHAFEIARKRNEEWDAGERDWSEGNVKGREGDAAEDVD